MQFFSLYWILTTRWLCYLETSLITAWHPLWHCSQMSVSYLIIYSILAKALRMVNKLVSDSTSSL